MGDFVAVMLDSLNDLDLFGHAGVMLQHLGKSVRTGNDILGLLLKKDEEIPIVGHKPLQESWHVTRSPLRSTSVAKRV